MSGENIEQEALFAEALRAYQARDFARAQELCDALLARDADSARAWTLKGLTRIEERRFDEAAELLDRGTRLDPHPGMLLNLANCHVKLGRLEEAVRAAQQALDLDPQLFGAQICLATAWHGLGRYEEALAVLEKARALRPRDHWTYVRRGATLAELGRLDEAERVLAMSASLEGGAPIYGLARFNEDFFAELETRSEGGIPSPEGVLTLESGSADYVVLACCDQVYFQRYGANFVHSYRQVATETSLLHLHIVDPAPGLAETVRNLAHRVGLGGVALTTELAPLGDGVGAGARKTYYSCARFLQMPHFLARYRRPIVCLDIDAVLEASLATIVQFARGADVALSRREPRLGPWVDVCAGMVAAEPTDAGLRYFELVRNFILHFKEQDALHWHLDQVALYCVALMMHRYLGNLRVAWIPPELQASAWQIGHGFDFRPESERFTRHNVPGFSPTSA